MDPPRGKKSKIPSTEEHVYCGCRIGRRRLDKVETNDPCGDPLWKQPEEDNVIDHLSHILP